MASTSDLHELTVRIETLEQIARDNSTLRAELGRERRRLRVQGALAFVTIVGVLLASPGNRTAMAQAGNNLFARVEALEQLTQFFVVQSDSVTGTLDLYIVGTNVHVLNSATPANANGLGNLIIGRNTSRGTAGPDERTGSHNLVIGDRNNYTGTEGVVIGSFNSIDGFQSMVFGGSRNEATLSGLIYGGRFNEANFGGLLFGGVRNLAQHEGVVVGGADNLAGSFEGNVVVGGQDNSAIASFNTVVGGFDNVLAAGSDHRTIIGGQ